MRTTTIHCNRCGSTILGGHSILTITTGELATRNGESLDLCGDCCERFDDWLRGPRRAAHDAVGAISSNWPVSSNGTVMEIFP